ncbi:sporulation integral membrane protein YlbJ [Dehalobacterium formicoaceticum]|uniref:Sporulation integral membrane protein YlbJ n=1 Tax=Dehalobacterium formicoaceticum TaxID=51515 RepID=A0ABT1Y603_9FIRM|nr:sporulation integral membrane protein YlbJ [Dehalobacterium formicoaceticum]MCR6546297.1 sporulation integral membrane protein YlbJ [Dehalobacterium formicoaceticum]
MKMLLPLTTILLCISMLIFPKETLAAATMGLETWWTIVLPALLPFFIMAELFLGLGVVHFISILLEPIMRPIFNLPGSAAFVVALGYSSGFPVGASLTTKLRNQHLCTRIEGERLISFTNNASPLFIFVAVSVGIFQNPALGLLLATAHYLSNLCLGFLLRFYGADDPEKIPGKINYDHLISKSFQAMFEAQKKDGRSLGKLLSDAISKSIQSLLTIGGFIVLFAVIIAVLGTSGIRQYLEIILALIFSPLHFPDPLITALSGGLFEMTLGVKMVGECSAALPLQIIAVSMIMGWGGLSIQAQVMGIISDSDLRFFPFFLTRIAHMLLAGLFTYVLIQSQVMGVVNMMFVPKIPHHPLLYVLIPWGLCLASPLWSIMVAFFWILVFNIRDRLKKFKF